MTNTLTMLAGLARQGVRSAAYFGLGEVTGRMARRSSTLPPRYRPERPVPSRDELFAAVWDLMRADAELVRRGICPPHTNDDGPPLEWLARVRAMFADLPTAARRAAEGDTHDVREVARPEGGSMAGLPAYYLQNFHYQTGGYLTSESARLYDIQVETLFMGTASLMRRRLLAPLAEFMRGKDQRRLQLADVACGTGRFLGQLLDVYPRLCVTGIDLSPAYVEEARGHLERLGRRGPRVTLTTGNAENLPLADGSQDVVSVIFLFHELPAPVRRRVAAELARVLKPGGLLLYLDSVQYGDTPAWDGMLEGFPHRFHEPYYRNYLEDDLDRLFADTGLIAHEQQTVLLSKMLVRRKT